MLTKVSDSLSAYWLFHLPFVCLTFQCYHVIMVTLHYSNILRKRGIGWIKQKKISAHMDNVSPLSEYKLAHAWKRIWSKFSKLWQNILTSPLEICLKG